VFMLCEDDFSLSCVRIMELMRMVERYVTRRSPGMVFNGFVGFLWDFIGLLWLLLVDIGFL
jgi:hypothetical protein